MSDLFLSTVKAIGNDNYADYYQALYWYCSDNHAGQNDLLYTILSQLQYKPSLSEMYSDCTVEIESDYHARCVYMALQLYAHIGEYHTVALIPVAARTDIYCVEFSRGVDKAYRVYQVDCEYLIIKDFTQ